MTSSSEKKQGLPMPAAIYSKQEVDMWTMMNSAIAKSGAVNLGQGFMNFAPEKFVMEAGAKCILDEKCQQYAPVRGCKRMLDALAVRYSKLLGREINPNTEIMTASGGNEAIFDAIAGFIEKEYRNEVILIDPAFDQYHANIFMIGGTSKRVSMKLNPDLDPENNSIPASEFKLDLDELEAAITERTRLLIITTPHNPTGKVLTQEELEGIAAIAIKHDLLVISDEVYFSLYYDGTEHRSISTIPGMWERTVVAGALGKLFGVTGWRIGWLVGPEHLISAAIHSHVQVVFTSPTPLMEAAGLALEYAETSTFYEDQRKKYVSCRKKLMDILDSVGLPYIIPQGSYFLLLNVGKVKIPDDFEIPQFFRDNGRCFMLAYFFATEIGIGSIPSTYFYAKENRHLSENYLRLAFCKTDETFEAARILDLALTKVPTTGWTQTSVALACEELGLSLMSHKVSENGGMGLIKHFFDKSLASLDSAASTPEFLENHDIKERVKYLSTFRIKQTTPYVNKWQEYVRKKLFWSDCLPICIFLFHLGRRNPHAPRKYACSPIFAI
ncbi:putative aminotransferase [Zancudomyces culisetae]|uniref:Putative aminotransferase n=1 Tax=Zancudomyces culisetae TaxID=1213189 RepID=A0A1R1PUW3_ZANCU|nr:putative aminotransferase [Zancudomyces culisetae]|eukprot:OMH84751.1 putative aminotransferase [Zancudomyces culisetae]